MILWLASWPRSGNTLLRMLLEDACGAQTETIYPEPILEFLFPGACVLDWSPETYARLAQDATLHLLKTHGGPIDQGPAICVVRDGRDACRSAAQADRCALQISIVGEGNLFPDWSAPFWAWNPLERPQTLLVRFEAMLADPDATAREIARWLNWPTPKTFENRFAECRAQCPRIFGGDRPRPDFTDSELALFWRIHGPAMKALGYGEGNGNRRTASAG